MRMAGTTEVVKPQLIVHDEKYVSRFGHRESAVTSTTPFYSVSAHASMAYSTLTAPETLIDSPTLLPNSALIRDL